MKTGFYIVKAQSPCCSSAHEVWTVRAKSAPEAKRRVFAANGGRSVYEARTISGNAWRQFTAYHGMK